MKEKIKNFLLNIKNFFKQKHSFNCIELIIIAILINFITMFLSFVEIKALDLCFNETHTEQIEETPQTESMRIEKDLKFANPTINDSIIAGYNYDVLYFAELNSDNFEYFYTTIANYVLPWGADHFIYPYYLTDTGVGYYNIYCYMVNEFSQTTAIISNVCMVASYGFEYYQPSSVFASYSLDSGTISTLDYVSSCPLKLLGNALGVSLDSFTFNGINIDVGLGNERLYNYISSVPFESTPQQPTLENAPSSLVNTIPSNASTTLPTNLGTKVYDSGSGVTITENHNEYNTFGFQIYYESNITYSETDLYRFTIDGITYDVEPNVYRYYLNDVNVVIYTLWNNTPIYYVFENLLIGGDWPFTLDYETRFNFTELSNMFASSVYIIDTYSDYIHINIEFAYLMTLNHDGEIQYLIDTEETSFEALIYSTTHSGNYADKGFDLDIIPQLDKNYSKMGVSQTNNMYSTIVHGGTINQVWSNAYNKGIGVGETNGYTNGYNDGIETGKTLQNPLNPIMDFISDGALVISNVFSFEILPNISLGTMLLFPLAIALIWFVIKLFMGG